MDTNDWVVLSDDGFSDFNEDCDEKHIFWGKRNSDSKSVLDMGYLSRETFGTSRNSHPRVPKQVVHVPIQFEPRIVKAPDEGLVEVNTKDHVEVTPVPSPITSEKIKGGVLEANHDTVSQVLSKIKEMESPKSIGRGLFPSPDIGALKFDDKGEAQEIMASPRMKIEKEMTIMDCDKVEDSSGGFNFWKWSLNGVGAICSFGVAAATICVLFFGSQQRNKIQHDQKIRFQIYTNDKRIKQVVQHATKLNEAISAVNGVPMTRARITCGGYYDGL
ncbi:cation channel family protein [Spatholobus suberectus]|nr:cation channel family protein [Spatholobus suberectus]